MIAVLFETDIKSGKADEYFSLAESLKPLLSKIDGFISIERFESVSTPGKYLSLSFWRDEEAITQWRNLRAHRRVQAHSRDAVFSDYRLRVAEVHRDYGKFEREEAPPDSREAHGLPSPLSTQRPSVSG